MDLERDEPGDAIDAVDGSGHAARVSGDHRSPGPPKLEVQRESPDAARSPVTGSGRHWTGPSAKTAALAARQRMTVLWRGPQERPWFTDETKRQER